MGTSIKKKRDWKCPKQIWSSEELAHCTLVDGKRGVELNLALTTNTHRRPFTNYVPPFQPISYKQKPIHLLVSYEYLEPQNCSALLSCQLSLRQLLTFGFWGQKLLLETKTIDFGDHPEWWWKFDFFSANISQHPKIPLFAAHKASGECGYARRIRKNTACFILFHLFSHLCKFSILTRINRQPTSAHNIQHHLYMLDRLLGAKNKNHRLSLDDTFLEHLVLPGLRAYKSSHQIS